MSGLARNGLPGPMEATMFFERGWSGQSSITRFQGLSGGKMRHGPMVGALPRGASSVAGASPVSASGAARASSKPGPAAVEPIAVAHDEPAGNEWLRLGRFALVERD